MADPPKEGQWIRLGAWVKFEDTVPQPSSNLGFKINGKINNEWLSDCEAGKWKYISVVGPVKPNGDNGFVLFIFDSMVETDTVRIAAPEMEIFDEEPKAREVKSKEPKTNKDGSKLIGGAIKSKSPPKEVEEKPESEGGEKGEEAPARTNKKKESRPKWPSDYYFDYGDFDKVDPLSRYVNDEDI